MAALKNASKLQSVIASKVTEIKANAFYNCDKLSSVTANDVTIVGNSAFEDCDGITITTLKNFSKLKVIGNSAFFKASKLDGTLTLPAILESVGSQAFASTGLDAVVLESNPSMGSGAFNNSDMLTLEISDATELDYSNTNTYGKVRYTRNTMTQSVTGARKYAGLILPFVPVANEDYVFYQLNSSSNSTEVVFDRVDSPVANTPYLFEYLGSTGAVTFESNGPVTIGGSNTHEFTAGSSWKATGVYNKQAKTSNGKLYSIKGGEFTRYENNLTVNPYRVYWTAPTTNAIKFRNGSDDVTEVEFAEIEDVNIPATYYDLTGRRVLEPVKGNLYIVNGKKMVY